MIPKKLLRPISSILIMVYFSSCATTYEITRRSELDIPDDLGELTVQTTDGKEYTFEHYSLYDSTLTGIGVVEKDSLKKSFSGKLNLSDIKQIEATQTDWGKTILITGVGAAVLLTFYIFWNKQDDGLKNEVVVRYPSGGDCGRKKYGGSCSGKISNNFHPNNENRLNAAGLKNMIDIRSLNPDRVVYFNIVKNSNTFHFKVVDNVNQIEIEMVDKLPVGLDSSDILTIELNK